MLLVVVVAALIVLLTAALSVIESAIIYVDELRLATILRNSSKNKPKNRDDIKYVIQQKDRHLSSMVVLITLISIAGSSVIGAIAAREFNDLGLAVFTVLLTYCMLVFAKILPKLYAVQVADQVLDYTAPFVRFVAFLLRPVIRFTLVWTRLFGIEDKRKPTLDELKGIIRHYGKTGIIARGERKMLEQALTSNRTTLGSFLEDTGPTVCLKAEATLGNVQERVLDQPYKRYLVVDNGKTTGVVLYRHLTSSLIRGHYDKKVSELARQVAWLEPDATLLEAMQALHETRSSVALLRGADPEKTRMVTAKQIYRAILQSA
ncbi:CNNM domain-containing protein [Endozoicomonas gorgoniicola]|uniref:CNNM domain-containing protein n=1 Tax=Endozoicomonas gorgoniicola TaxID=1234144 RepID=A0ABT3MZ17_9GAMM|nr:CNNM domain-containing protein [Endozoicomonas gorgoniicola]MCW7554621.1 CNNM domain-containing protein [Endozoicomonas gorgoniicola]